MNTEALLEKLRSHLEGSELCLADRQGRPLDGLAQAFALREIAEVALDVVVPHPRLVRRERATVRLDADQLERLVRASR